MSAAHTLTTDELHDLLTKAAAQGIRKAPTAGDCTDSGIATKVLAEAGYLPESIARIFAKDKPADLGLIDLNTATEEERSSCCLDRGPRIGDEVVYCALRRGHDGCHLGDGDGGVNWPRIETLR